MSIQESGSSLRLAVIAALVKYSTPHALGRTAIMKLIYFLQALHKVPLGYDFRIYTYGPYDSQVLEDLKVIELKGAVKSSTVGYAVGTGYRITTGPEADGLITKAPSVSSFFPAIETVLEDFGNRSATDLEMASTIVFVDRFEAATGRNVSITDVSRKVREMKPRLELDRILEEAKGLKDKGYIGAF